jgi:hypothetical protein
MPLGDQRCMARLAAGNGEYASSLCSSAVPRHDVLLWRISYKINNHVALKTPGILLIAIAGFAV